MSSEFCTRKQLFLSCTLSALFASGLTAGVTAWLYSGQPRLISPPGLHTAPSPIPTHSLQAANTLYDQQNWSAAIAAYEKVIAAGTDNADVRTDLGNCFRFIQQPDRALEYYRSAQKLNPQHEFSLYNQVTLLAEIHRHEEAATLARQFMERFPQSKGLEAIQKIAADTASHPQ